MPAESANATRFSRRQFLRVGGAGVLAAPLGVSVLAAACASVPQAPAAASVTRQGTGSTALAYPSYIRSTVAATPDLPGNAQGVEDAYSAYPSQRTALNLAPPGRGGIMNSFVFTSTASPRPVDQNPTWQDFNKRLNVDLRLNISTDVPTKLPLIIAGNDLPDTIYVPPGPSNIAGFPDFLGSRCTDLTPYLAGDAVKAYPNLANFPPFLWKSSGVVFGNKIYGVPIARNPVGKGLMFHTELAGPIGSKLPTSADEFKRALLDLSRPQANVFGLGSAPTLALGADSGELFPQLFGAPNNWKVDTSGRLVKDFETEEFRAALGYARDLFAAGVYHPDTLQYQDRDMVNDFVAGKFVFCNWAWNFEYAWRNSITVNANARLNAASPFSADGTTKPVYYLASANFGTTILKKADDARIQELLGMMNYLAAPIGTEESLFLKFGIQGVDYTWDDRGNPVPTPNGYAQANVPWQWIAQPPKYQYSAVRSAEYAQVAHAAEVSMISIGIEDPTATLYSPSDGKLGPPARQAMRDGLTAIVSGREPLAALDQLVADWRRNAGDAIRAELSNVLAGSRG